MCCRTCGQPARSSSHGTYPSRLHSSPTNWTGCVCARWQEKKLAPIILRTFIQSSITPNSNKLPPPKKKKKKKISNTFQTSFQTISNKIRSPIITEYRKGHRTVFLLFYLSRYHEIVSRSYKIGSHYHKIKSRSHKLESRSHKLHNTVL